MKSALMILAGVTALVSAAFLIQLTRKCSNETRLSEISDEGYETAHDILYPNTDNRGKLHYGPVLPQHAFNNSDR